MLTSTDNLDEEKRKWDGRVWTTSQHQTWKRAAEQIWRMRQTEISGELKEDEVMWLQEGHHHQLHGEVGSELLLPETGAGVTCGATHNNSQDLSALHSCQGVPVPALHPIIATLSNLFLFKAPQTSDPFQHLIHPALLEHTWNFTCIDHIARHYFKCRV